MKIPVGDILRKLLPKWTWLNFLKGTSIKRGDVEIMLDQDHGLNRSDPKPFNRPSRPGRRR